MWNINEILSETVENTNLTGARRTITIRNVTATVSIQHAKRGLRTLRNFVETTLNGTDEGVSPHYQIRKRFTLLI